MLHDNAKYNPIIANTAASGSQSDVATCKVDIRFSDAAVQVVLDAQKENNKEEEEEQEEEWASASEGDGDTDMPSEQTPNSNIGPRTDGQNLKPERQPANAASGEHEKKQSFRAVSDPEPYSTQEVNAACDSGLQCVFKRHVRQETTRPKHEAESETSPKVVVTSEIDR